MSEGFRPPLEDVATPVPGAPIVTFRDTAEIRAALSDYVQRCGEDQLLALLSFVSVAPEAELMLQNLDFLCREQRQDR